MLAVSFFLLNGGFVGGITAFIWAGVHDQSFLLFNAQLFFFSVYIKRRRLRLPLFDGLQRGILGLELVDIL